MVKKYFYVAFAVLSFCSSVVGGVASAQGNPAADTLRYPEEKYFRNLQQLTFGGDNAEAYWSYDEKAIVFQRTSVKDGIPCDQIYYGKVPAKGEKFTYQLVSTGKGRTTCAFFTKDNKHIVYASTHEGSEACPPVPDRSKYGNRYIWPLYSSYDIYMADLTGKIVKKLTDTPGYDAEATLSPDGKKMVFSSVRNGDLDLYVMDLASGVTTQVTRELGYDGGAWFSPDGKKLIWRASRPKTEAEIKEYKELLAEGLVAPTQMEVFVANADGSNVQQVTSLGQANWAPNFKPDGNFIFCSNHEYKRGFPFNMYVMKADGSGMEKISHDKGFDAFPMFSPNGKKIIFSSNRNNGGTRDTNIFIADWEE
ncbi:PD40 domain-containing protein [Flavisolibacter sp. BT320]|nr:PD40 domain-containing protein [Flavisolibacter longurius]